MPLLTFENLVRLRCEETGYIECYIALWIWRIVPFTLVIVGLTGNILNLVILLRKQLRKKSTAIYLIFLTVSDTVILCFGTLVQTIRNLFSADFYSWTSFTCTVTEWLVFTAGLVSCWLIVLITGERTFVTLFPTKARFRMTQRNALYASVTLVIVTAIFNGHLIYANTLNESTVNITKGNQTEERHSKSCTLRLGQYTDFYKNIWSIMVLVVGTVLPVVLIVTGNCIVGISLIKNRRTVLQGDNTAVRARNPDTRKGFSIKMFFILCGVYIVTVLPFCVYFTTLNFNTQVDEHTLAKHQLIHIIIKCFLWSNFSFNFLLYFMTGSMFKKEFRNVITELHEVVSKFAVRGTVHPVTVNETV